MFLLPVLRELIPRPTLPHGVTGVDVEADEVEEWELEILRCRVARSAGTNPAALLRVAEARRDPYFATFVVLTGDLVLGRVNR
jgi:hypothetical protein